MWADCINFWVSYRSTEIIIFRLLFINLELSLYNIKINMLKYSWGSKLLVIKHNIYSRIDKHVQDMWTGYTLEITGIMVKTLLYLVLL